MARRISRQFRQHGADGAVPQTAHQEGGARQYDEIWMMFLSRKFLLWQGFSTSLDLKALLYFLVRPIVN
jgi:hypothetical protein